MPLLARFRFVLFRGQYPVPVQLSAEDSLPNGRCVSVLGKLSDRHSFCVCLDDLQERKRMTERETERERARKIVQEIESNEEKRSRRTGEQPNSKFFASITQVVSLRFVFRFLHPPSATYLQVPQGVGTIGPSRKLHAVWGMIHPSSIHYSTRPRFGEKSEVSLFSRALWRFVREG